MGVRGLNKAIPKRALGQGIQDTLELKNFSQNTVIMVRVSSPVDIPQLQRTTFSGMTTASTRYTPDKAN